MTQRWFQGPDGCDLFLWYDDSAGLSQIQLTFQGRAVEWSLREGLRTAQLRAFGPRHDSGHVVYDAHVDPEALELAREMLEDAPVDDITLALIRRHLGLR